MDTLILLADATENLAGAPVAIALQIATIALSIWTASQLKKKDRATLRDDKPSVTASRGAYLSLLIGTDIPPPIIGWVGARFTDTNDGSKKGDDAGTSMFFESAWHQICIGPAAKLWAIRRNGVVIFQGPVSSDVAPSGTLFSTEWGDFSIYWGGKNQPVSSRLESLTGVSSRFPHLCYILWDPHKLGTAAVWPQLDYEVEVRPFETGQLTSPAWIDGTWSFEYDSGGVQVEFEIDGTTGGPAGFFEFDTLDDPQIEKYFTLGDQIYVIEQDPGGGGRSDVVSYVVDHTTVEFTPPLGPWVVRIFPIGGIEPGFFGAFIWPWHWNSDDGANGGHIVYQLLFGSHPHGLGLEKSNFDIPSLDNASWRLWNEKLKCTVNIAGGETAKDVLKNVMQDLGLVMRPRMSDGKTEFALIRSATGEVPSIPSGLIVTPEIEVISVHMGNPVDVPFFVFPDRIRNYRDFPEPDDDDLNMDFRGHPSTKRVELYVPRDITTCRKIKARRSQEELADRRIFNIEANRNALSIPPASPFFVEGIAPLLRCLSVRMDANSGLVKIRAVQDFFAASAAVPAGGAATIEGPEVIGGVEPTQVPGEDPLIEVIEVPGYLHRDALAGSGFIIPRIRVHENIGLSTIWASTDGSTYERIASTSAPWAGGRLLARIEANEGPFLEVGWDYAPIGPDGTNIADLSTDEVAWYRGDQWLVIDDEIMFVRGVEIISADVWRLRGVLRGRYGTAIDAHDAGTGVFIRKGSPEIVTWRLAVKGQEVFLKVQPRADGAPLSLTRCRAMSLVSEGKNVAPLGVVEVTTESMSSSWISGEDASLTWTYRSAAIPRSGAGMQRAGEITQASPAEGVFRVQVKDASTGDLKRTVFVEVALWDYTQANMVTDFGAEPASFIAEVTNIMGGYHSPPVSQLIVRI